MSRVNPETVVTKKFRAHLERDGFFVKKLSDSFTRGIPDLLIAASRIILIEMKSDATLAIVPDGTKKGWRQLGLSGAQDENIRAIWTKTGTAYAVIGFENNFTVWAPHDATRTPPGETTYICLANELAEIIRMLR